MILNLVVLVRRDDIINRKKIVENKIKLRLEKMKAREEFKEKRNNELKLAKEVKLYYKPTIVSNRKQ